ncbi:CapA family protein [Luteipulveratus mongoliensis]|uniref:CapA family protein n=1 Tax=Luteipulveratus mongoliensis TaxID=571913 RepID=UPI0006984540|nr:CapA family protein [Luteipulveratus mongoliensis]
MTRVVLPGLAAAVVLGSVATMTIRQPSTPDAALITSSIDGIVVDEQGRAVPGATIKTDAETVVADEGGHFDAAIRGAELITASAPGHKSRTQAAAPDQTVSIELTSQADHTVSIRFGGDVMMARRYYEPADGKPPLLTQTSTVADHAKILAPVAPLLGDADLTVVNLETPLVTDPYYDPSKPRPKRYHPSKSLAFGSAPATAQALKQSGVDAVSLGNNHLYDALDPGLSSTIKTLDQAGIVHFGAGPNENAAWKPAIVTRAGQKVALLGCTTVDGHDEAVPYVAGPARGGAAFCTEPRMRAAVAAAKKQAANVVVMIHGAIEYQRLQTPEVRALFRAATEAGAQAIIGGHPHVTGGITQSGKSVVAETMGNLVFDQDLWSTFPSYLLRVDLRQGAPVYSSVDPLSIQRYHPVPAVGALAEASARIAAGSVPGQARLGGAGALLPTSNAPPASTQEVKVGKGEIRSVAPGWWFSGAATPTGGVRAGTDLLFGTGTFEDQDVDPTTSGGDLWTLGKYARISTGARCKLGDGTSDQGIELLRSPVSTKDVYATPSHRQMITPGQSLTLTTDLRRASPGATLELRWYYRSEGKSMKTTSVTLPITDTTSSGCRRVVLDAVAPKDAHAVQPFLRLAPPSDGQKSRRLAVDNLRLIAWAPVGQGGRQYDVVRGSLNSTGRFVLDRPSSQRKPSDPLLEDSSSDN